MSFQRPETLRGGCCCGRNRYLVHIPKEPSRPSDIARVLFDTHPAQRMAQSSPLAAFLRVPLDWYHSTTFAFFPDETSSMIRRVYSSPHQGHSMRHFCGFCGTPLSYWSEQPPSEADFIQVALGSLSSENLHDLEDLGLLPDSDDDEVDKMVFTTPQGTDLVASPSDEVMVRNELGKRDSAGGLPWFNTLISGSKLGNMRTVMATGSAQSRFGHGSVCVEWEVVECTDEDGPTGEKRKYAEQSSTADNSRMEDVR